MSTGPSGAVFASKARKKIMEHNVRLPVLPSDVKVEVPSTVVFRGYGTALQATWQETLPEEEEAEVVAVGGEWAAVATSAQVSHVLACSPRPFGLPSSQKALQTLWYLRTAVVV